LYEGRRFSRRTASFFAMTAAHTPSPIEKGASWISSDAVESSLMRRCVPESVRQRRTAVWRSSERRRSSRA
jgi:hypothetical protein